MPGLPTRGRPRSLDPNGALAAGARLW